MYPFERFNKVLKSYVRNRFYPEGCIAESYLGEESIEFCTDFLRQSCTTAGLPKDEGKLSGPLSTAIMKSGSGRRKLCNFDIYFKLPKGKDKRTRITKAEFEKTKDEFEQTKMELMSQIAELKSKLKAVVTASKFYHWILIMIWESEIFILNPLPHQKRFTALEEALVGVIRSYNAQIGRVNKNPIIKNLIGSPKQPGGSECGYVVMRYMKDIYEDKEIKFLSNEQTRSVQGKGYLVEECLSFCSRFLSDERETKHTEGKENLGYPIRSRRNKYGKAVHLGEKLWNDAHRCILFNCGDMEVEKLIEMADYLFLRFHHKGQFLKTKYLGQELQLKCKFLTIHGLQQEHAKKKKFANYSQQLVAEKAGPREEVAVVQENAEKKKPANCMLVVEGEGHHATKKATKKIKQKNTKGNAEKAIHSEKIEKVQKAKAVTKPSTRLTRSQTFNNVATTHELEQEATHVIDAKEEVLGKIDGTVAIVGDTIKPKMCRGPSKMNHVFTRKLEDGLVISLNKKLQPVAEINKIRAELGSFVGTLARQYVQLDYINWSVVPESHKNS
ncbi:hypothetical protein AgCh_034574 [Apium graveolens]